jgi:hypothetical protein
VGPHVRHTQAAGGATGWQPHLQQMAAIGKLATKLTTLDNSEHMAASSWLEKHKRI